MKRRLSYVCTDALSDESYALLREHLTAMRDAGHEVVVFHVADKGKRPDVSSVPLFEYTPENAQNLERLLPSERGAKIACDSVAAHLLARLCPGDAAYLVLDAENRHVRSYVEARRVLASFSLGLPLITTSPWLGHVVKELAEREVRLVRRGVHPEFHTRDATERDPFEIVLVHAGDPDEATSVACSVIERAQEREPRLTLAVIGRPLPGCGHIRKRTCIVETEAQLAQQLSGAGCFLTTSQYELFDLGRLEAMACGCPVVAAAITGAPPRVAEGGSFTLPAADIEGLADAVVKCATDPGFAGDLARRGRDEVSDRTFARHAEEFLQALGDLGRLSDADEGDASMLTVSVVIPTKNAGPDFRYLLAKLETAAERFDLQTVVVDSGSTDGTVRLAREHGAEVLEIPSSEFNHGGTRNRGADLATGDFIVFLTQDAIPLGERWLDDLVQPLLDDPQVAAVRGRDVPRSDGDLFCGWMDWNHTGGLQLNQDRIVHLPDCDIRSRPPGEQRSLAQLADTCCCFRGDVFRRMRFAELNFAEDLELGIRMLEQGYKLGSMFSTGVIHSHNRDAFYVLKRFYVDAKMIPRILGFRPSPPNAEADEVFWSIRDTYARLSNVLEEAPERALDPHVLAARLKDGGWGADGETRPGDATLDVFVASLPAGRRAGSGRSMALSVFLQTLAAFDVYVRTVHGTLEHGGAEVAECYYKLFGSSVGSLLGSMMSADESAYGPQPAALDHVLAEGV